MITQKFKKFFKKVKENSKRKDFGNPGTLLGNSSLDVSNVVSMTTL